MIEEAIVSLLLRHNCVVVPAFGGFVAQSTGAIIDMQTGSITPPRKSVLFNKQLINNDGLLISHLSQESTMDYFAAESFLETKVKEWRADLKEGKRVSIDKIGHLYLDGERNIAFEQDRYFNLLLQSYGLNKVHFISEEDVITSQTILESEEVLAEATIIPITTNTYIETRKEESRREIAAVSGGKQKLWKYAAAAVLLPFAFFTYWIPVETNVLESGMISIKDFNPMYHAGEGIYQKNDLSFPIEFESPEQSVAEAIHKLPAGSQTYHIEFGGKKIPVRVNSVQKPIEKLAIKKEKIQPVVKEKEIVQPKAETLPTKPKVETAVAKPSSGKMHYIVGCFSDKANAEAMVKTMRERGLQGQILDEKNGMIRISAGGASSEADFEKLAKKAQSIGYKGWKL